MATQNTNSRLIDMENGVRTRPMKVLMLGMGRTGTLSLHEALKRLKYKPYHMAEALRGQNLSHNFDLWTEAYDAKYKGIGPAFTRTEFDKLLGDYDGVADVPCVHFVEELIAAYPDAKVILTNRDPDSWAISMRDSIYTVLSWRSWPYVASWDPVVAGPWWRFGQTCLDTSPTLSGRTDYLSDDYLRTIKREYIGHYEKVRRVAKEHNTPLLEFSSADGWKPLCEFLEEEVPLEEYPKVNDNKWFLMFHRMIWGMAILKMFVKLVMPVAIAVGAIYYLRL